MVTRNSNVYPAPGNNLPRTANLNLNATNPLANLGTGNFLVTPVEQRTAFVTDGSNQGFVNAVQNLDNTPSITYVFTNSRAIGAGNMYIGQSINDIRTRYANVASMSGGLRALATDASFEVTIYVNAWPEVIEAFWIQNFWQQANRGGLTNVRQ